MPKGRRGLVIGPCSVEGCTGLSGVVGSARGLCRAHYRRWQRYGTPDEPLRKVVSYEGQVCIANNCQMPAVSRSLCMNHYAKWRRKHAGNKERSAKFKAKIEALRTEEAGRPRQPQCELCGKDGRTVFDHDHATGNFRGWLCDRCNRTLGQVKDSVELLEKMIQYIRAGGIGYGSVDHCSTEETA